MVAPAGAQLGRRAGAALSQARPGRGRRRRGRRRRRIREAAAHGRRRRRLKVSGKEGSSVMY